MNSWALANLAASITASSLTPKLPYLIFSFTVVWNKWVSCKTIPKDFLKEDFLISFYVNSVECNNPHC